MQYKNLTKQKNVSLKNKNICKYYLQSSNYVSFSLIRVFDIS